MAEATMEKCAEFQALRSELGLFGSKWAGFLLSELSDLVGESWICGELYDDLRVNGQKRETVETTLDTLGTIVADASLNARGMLVKVEVNGEMTECLALPWQTFKASAPKDVWHSLYGEKPATETPEERLAREWELHPDEAKPRGETWLHERRHWKSEVDTLRAESAMWLEQAKALESSLIEERTDRQAEVADLNTLAAQRYAEIERLSGAVTLLEQRVKNQAEYIEGLHKQLEEAREQPIAALAASPEWELIELSRSQMLEEVARSFAVPAPVTGLCAAMAEIAPHIGAVEDDAISADPQPDTGCCDEFTEGDCCALPSDVTHYPAPSCEAEVTEETPAEWVPGTHAVSAPATETEPEPWWTVGDEHSD